MDEGNRFSRALKSPIVMVGLCLLAGIAVYYNVIEPTLDSSLPISVASTAPLVAAPQSITASSHQTHEEVATQWIPNPKRDPFAPISRTIGSQPPLKQSSPSTSRSNRPKQPSRNKLTLKAIAIEAQHRSAIINRQVVHEGEVIEGYQVVSIQLKGVWLRRYGKKQFLPFATKVAS